MMILTQRRYAELVDDTEPHETDPNEDEPKDTPDGDPEPQDDPVEETED